LAALFVSGQELNSVVRGIAFALKLLASTLAGAALTLPLWKDNVTPHTYPLYPDQIATPYSQGEGQTVVYSQTRVAGTLSDAASARSDVDQVASSDVPRRIRTLRFADTSAENTATRSAPLKAALPISRTPLPLVRNWRYQLTNVNPSEVANSSTDLVVIDYSANDGPFSRAQVDRMKRKPDGSRRIVLSYISIGEAEIYRWYWHSIWTKNPPVWLASRNSQWRENYGVRFWHSEWQRIVFEYLDKIISAGFDGVYLDKVDEFETMGHKDEMIELVARISSHAKAQRSDFIVVSQNGDQLIPNSNFRNAIDAFAREDLLYGEDVDGARNDASSIRESIKRLKMLTAEGKPVFVVEYPKKSNQADTAKKEISEHGFIGLTARRALDVL
jgi:cysteinyl-tRNA synthetase